MQRHYFMGTLYLCAGFSSENERGNGTLGFFLFMHPNLVSTLHSNIDVAKHFVISGLQCLLMRVLACCNGITTASAHRSLFSVDQRGRRRADLCLHCVINPLKPNGNYIYIYHLLLQSVTLHFVFMGFV
jgi:hypothetical protein